MTALIALLRTRFGTALKRMFTPALRVCGDHAETTRNDYYILDEDNCWVCYNKVIPINRKPK